MSWINMLVPVVSLIAGWFLSEMSKKSQISRERRALVGRALSNLLELHHQIRAVETVLQLLTSRFNLTTEAEAVVRQIIQQIIPENDEYVARYEEAVAQLSESDPITAFRLSTNAQIPRFITKLRTLSSLNGIQNDEMSFFEKQLKDLFVPHIENAIKELARLHGRATSRQVHAMLDSPREIPDEINVLIQKMQGDHQE
ncbi:MAG TPA: hypothetical protein DE312_02575 [Gallionella sp.]|nr:MAG: hypothetical protein A2Z87_04250 [Gallionellales bacterium GWA2_54_124]HCI52211.1 hypothetical protein [Gallionella sp.]